MKKVRIYLLIISLVVFSSFFSTKSITVEKKDYKSASSDQVSTRELAMLASLVYEDVPNDSNYSPTSKSAGKGCVLQNNGNVQGKNGEKCFFTALENKTNTSLKRGGYPVYQYIEGLSERKVNLRLVSTATSAFKEDGEKYYFLNFANTSELEKNWQIVHYSSENSLGNLLALLPDQATFDAITFNKGDNYVIAFRGTDYPDLFEWVEDVAYAINGKHAQADLAYAYAQAEYGRIINEKPNAKIYVVGHSLGAYLAQVGGAAIVDYASGRRDSGLAPYEALTGNNVQLDAYNVYTNPTNLVQVAYFNGMGVGGMFAASNFAKNVDNALVYLSTHDINGNIASTGRTVNYSNAVPSSGRLVLYSMDADPVSDIGLHYGEIYKLDVGADVISNHNGTHPSVVGNLLESALSGNDISTIVESVSSVIHAGKLNEILNPKGKYIPSYVADKINDGSGGHDVTKYSLGSILTNLSNDIKSFYGNYGQYGAVIDNLFDHFNMNHETDSFACIIDKDNGKLKQSKLSVTVSSPSMSCQNGVCSSKTDYSMPHTSLVKNTEYSLGNAINSSSLVDMKYKNFITLTANISGGCVKKYVWEYSYDGNTYHNLGTTVNKQIIVPKSIIGVSNNNLKKVYFRVTLKYGDNFYETKSKVANGLLVYEKSSTSTKFNPTNNEDRSMNTKTDDVVSSPTAVTFIYDNKAPSCRFEPSSTSIKRGKSTTVRFVCDDVSAVNFNSGKFKLSFTLLIKGFSYSTKCYNEEKYCDITIKASSNILLTANSQTITYDDKISDVGGNQTSNKVSASLSLKRVK